MLGKDNCEKVLKHVELEKLRFFFDFRTENCWTSTNTTVSKQSEEAHRHLWQVHHTQPTQLLGCSSRAVRELAVDKDIRYLEKSSKSPRHLASYSFMISYAQLLV